METLWLEIEQGETDVAKLVREMDILERSHQAMIYDERAGHMKDFEVFRLDLDRTPKGTNMG